MANRNTYRGGGQGGRRAGVSVDDFMRQYGSGSQSGSQQRNTGNGQQRSTGSGQQGRTGNGVSVEDFMGQYGSGAKPQTAQPTANIGRKTADSPYAALLYGGGQQTEKPGGALTYNGGAGSAARGGETSTAASSGGGFSGRSGKMWLDTDYTPDENTDQATKDLVEERERLLQQLKDNKFRPVGISQGAEADVSNAGGIYDRLHQIDAELGMEPQAYGLNDRVANIFTSTAERQAANYTEDVGSIMNPRGLVDTSLTGVSTVLPGFRTVQKGAMWLLDKVMPDWWTQTPDRLKGAQQKVYDTADALDERSKLHDAQARTGANAVGNFAIDLSEGAIDLAADALANTIAPGSGLGMMGARSYGSGHMEARHKGLDEHQQVLSGTKSALIEVMTEQIGGPFEKVYGKTFLGKWTKGFTDKISSRAGQKALKLFADALGEGAEEALSDIANAVADRLLGLTDEGWEFLKDPEFWAQVLHDALVGGALGAGGGAVSLARGGGDPATVQQQAEAMAMQAVEQTILEAEQEEQGGTEPTAQTQTQTAPAASPADALLQEAGQGAAAGAQAAQGQGQQTASPGQDQAPAPRRALPLPQIAMPDSPRPAQQRVNRLLTQAQDLAQLQQAAQTIQDEPALSAAFREVTGTEIEDYVERLQRQAQAEAEAAPQTQEPPVQQPQAQTQEQPAQQQPTPAPAQQTATQQTQQQSEAPTAQQTQQAQPAQAAAQQAQQTAQQQAPSPADVLAQTATQGQQTRQAPAAQAQDTRLADDASKESTREREYLVEDYEFEDIRNEIRSGELKRDKELRKIADRYAYAKLREMAGLSGYTRYASEIAQFRREHPDIARQVDAALAKVYGSKLKAAAARDRGEGQARQTTQSAQPVRTSPADALAQAATKNAAAGAQAAPSKTEVPAQKAAPVQTAPAQTEAAREAQTPAAQEAQAATASQTDQGSNAAAGSWEETWDAQDREAKSLDSIWAQHPELEGDRIYRREQDKINADLQEATNRAKAATGFRFLSDSELSSLRWTSPARASAYEKQASDALKRADRLVEEAERDAKRRSKEAEQKHQAWLDSLTDAERASRQKDIEARKAYFDRLNSDWLFGSPAQEAAGAANGAAGTETAVRPAESSREAPGEFNPAQTLADAASGRGADAKARPYLSFEDILKRGEAYRAEAEKRTAGQPRRVLPEVTRGSSTQKSPASQAESQELYRATKGSEEKLAEHRAEVRKQNATAEGIRRAQGSAGVEQTGMTEEQAKRIRDISGTAPGLSRKALADRAAAKYHLDDEASREYGDIVTTGVDSIFEDGRNASRIASGEDEWASVPTSYRLDILNAYVDARALSIAKSANGSDPVLKDPNGDGYLTWEEMSDGQKEGFLPAQYRDGFLHYFVRDGEIVRETPEIITPTERGHNRETDRYSAEFTDFGITDAPDKTAKPKPTVKAEMQTSRIEELKKKLPRQWDFYVKGAKKEIARSIKGAPEGQKRQGLEYAAKRILKGEGDFSDLPVVLRNEVLADAQGIDSAYRRDAMAQDLELRADWKHDTDQADIPEGFTYHGQFIPYSDADLAARKEAQDRSDANKHRKNYEKWLERKYRGKAISGGAYGTPRIDIRSDLAQRVMRSRQLLDDMIAGTGSFASFSASNRLDLLRSIYPDADWHFDSATNSITLSAEKAKRSEDAFKFRRAPKQKDYTVKGGMASGKQAQKAGPGGPATGSERVVSEQDLANSARVSGRDGLVRDTVVDTEGRSGSSSEEAQAARSGGDLTGAPVLSSEEELAAWRDGLKYATEELGAKPIGVLTPEMQRVKDHASKLGVPVTFLSRFDSKPSGRFKHLAAFFWRPGGGVFLTFGKETKTNIAKILHHEVVHFFVKKHSNGRANQGGIFGLKMLKSSGLPAEDIAAAGAVYRRTYQDGYAQDTFGKSYEELSPAEQRFVSHLIAEEMLCDAASGVSEKYELAGITAEQLDALRKHALNMCVESGLITEEQRDEMERFSSEEIADDLLPELADEAKQTEQKPEDSEQPKAPRKPRSSTKSETDKQAGQARGDWRLGTAAAKKLDAEHQAEQDARWQEAEKRWQAEHEGFSPDVEADDWESDDLPPLTTTQEDTVSEEDAAMEEILRDRDAMRKEYADRKRRQREEQRQKQQQERAEALDEVRQEALDRERAAEQAAENEARQQREDQREAEEAEYVPEKRPMVSVEAVGEKTFGELTTVAKSLQEHVKVTTKGEDGKDVTKYGPFASTFKPLADAFQGMLDGKNGFKKVFEAYRDLSFGKKASYGEGFQDKALLDKLEVLAEAMEYGSAFEKGTGDEPVLKKEYADRLVRLTKQMVFRFGRLERSFESRPELKEEFDKAGHSEKGANGFLDVLNRLQLRTSTAFKRLAGFDRQSGKQLYKLADKVDSSVLQAINIEQTAQEYLAKVTGMKGFKAFSRGKTTIKNIVPGLSYGDRLSSNMALSLVMTLETEGAIDHIVDGGQLEMPKTEREYFGGKNDAGYGEKGGHALRFDPLQQSTRERIILAKNAVDAEKARAEAAKELQKLAEDMKTELFKDPVAKAAYEATAPLMYFMKRTLNKTGRAVWGVDVAHGDSTYFPLEKMGSQYRSGLFADEMPSFDTFSNVQERTGGDSGLRIRSYTEVIQHYISASSRWAAYADLADTLDMMTRNFGPPEGSAYSSLTQLAHAKLGKGWAHWIEDYVNDLNGVSKGDKDNPGQKFANWMRSAIASASLVANIGVALKQTPSGLTFMSVVDPDLVAKHFIGNTFRTNKSFAADALVQAVGGHSRLLASRMAGLSSIEVGEMLQSGRKFKLPGWMSCLITSADFHTVASGLMACADQIDRRIDNGQLSLKKGSDAYYQAVSDLFEEAVLHTQPIYNREARSAMNRSSSEYLRTAAMFTTQPNQNYNTLVETIGEWNAARRSGDKDRIKAAVKPMVRTVVGQCLSAMLFSALNTMVQIGLHKRKQYDDEEGELDWGKVAALTGYNFANTVLSTSWVLRMVTPVAIDAVTTLLNKADKDIPKSGLFFGTEDSIYGQINDVFDSFKSFLEKPTLKAGKDFAFAASSAFGIPMRNVYGLLNTAAMYGMDIYGNNPKHEDDVITWLDKYYNSGSTSRGKQAMARALSLMAKGHTVSAHHILSSLDYTDEDLLGGARTELKEQFVLGQIDEQRYRDIMRGYFGMTSKDIQEAIDAAEKKRELNETAERAEAKSPEAWEGVQKTLKDGSWANDPTGQTRMQAILEMDMSVSDTTVLVSNYMGKDYTAGFTALLRRGNTPDDAASIMQELCTDGDGKPTQAEIYKWYKADTSRAMAARAVWDAYNTKTSFDEYLDKMRTDPVEILMSAGMSEDKATSVKEEIDANGKSGFSQTELWDYYLAHPSMESIIEELWASRGWTKSWEEYKKKHGQ